MNLRWEGFVKHVGFKGKGKGKDRIPIEGYLHGKPDQPRFTISEVAVDWQEPMVLQRNCGHPLQALTYNWTRGCS